MTITGKELKEIRKTYGLTQREMSTGVMTTTYYGLVERGVRAIPILERL